MPDDLSRDAFLDALRRSRLFEADDLVRFRAIAPGTSARQLAESLVRSGELTHYQSHKLLRGRTQGLVVGPYRILTPLGRGGMGTLVYMARDRRMCEALGDSVLVALKVLPHWKAEGEPKVLARFCREMELGRRVDHPNVVRTCGAGDSEKVHYLALEYVPGKTVRQLVLRDGPLPSGIAARIFADVAAGLSHMHARGIVHRDVKPANVMVRPDGRAVLLDLGLAYVPGDPLPQDPSIVGGRGYIVGTMDYLAPEQAQDAVAVGPVADLYGLGCSLHFALTGSVPYPAEETREKIRRHRRDAVPFIANIPPDLARFAQQLMAKTPAERPQSAEAAATQLAHWATPTTQTVRVDSVLELTDVEQWDSTTSEDGQLLELPDEEPFTQLGTPLNGPERQPAVQVRHRSLLWVVGAALMLGALALLTAIIVAITR